MINVGQFTIRSTTEEPTGSRLEICIVPSTVVGAGYHTTTQLVLEILPELVKSGDVVYDLGSGNGILAIAAAKLGAKAFAVETNNKAFNTLKKNIPANSLRGRVIPVKANIKDMPPIKADIILDNSGSDGIFHYIKDTTARLVIIVSTTTELLPDIINEATDLTVINSYTRDNYVLQILERR